MLVGTNHDIPNSFRLYWNGPFFSMDPSSRIRGVYVSFEASILRRMMPPSYPSMRLVETQHGEWSIIEGKDRLVGVVKVANWSNLSREGPPFELYLGGIFHGRLETKRKCINAAKRFLFAERRRTFWHPTDVVIAYYKKEVERSGDIETLDKIMSLQNSYAPARRWSQVATRPVMYAYMPTPVSQSFMMPSPQKMRASYKIKHLCVDETFSSIPRPGGTIGVIKFPA